MVLSIHYNMLDVYVTFNYYYVCCQRWGKQRKAYFCLLFQAIKLNLQGVWCTQGWKVNKCIENMKQAQKVRRRNQLGTRNQNVLYLCNHYLSKHSCNNPSYSFSKKSKADICIQILCETKINYNTLWRRFAITWGGFETFLWNSERIFAYTGTTDENRRQFGKRWTMTAFSGEHFPKTYQCT